MTENSLLKINDIFWTFQGEGLHAGRRALFVRMPFCNLSCHWCDTEFNSFRPYTENEFKVIATASVPEHDRFAVITGGEPMLNKQTHRVISLLKNLGFEIACETNGTAPILDGIDFATVSPKRFSQGRRTAGELINTSYFIHPEAYKAASEFKYVVDTEFSFHVLERHDLSDSRRYSLSPEFGNFKESLIRIQDYIAKNPGWRISLQTHKWMGVK